jgi:ADP-heptose:LPS heptosyltransferase
MKTALVIRRGGLGDTVLTAPLLAALRSAGYAPHFAGNVDFARLFRRYHAADRVLSTEDLELWAVALDSPAGERARARLGAYELVFGEGLALPGHRAAIPFDPVPRSGAGHAAAQLLSQLVRALPDLPAAPDPVPRLVRLRAPVARGAEVLIHPGSGSVAKCWDPHELARVARTLVVRGRRVTVVVGEAEHARAATLLEPFDPSVDVLHEPSIDDLAGRIATAACFVGNDSGPAHLAAALLVPTVAVFGPTDPELWAPAGPHVRVVRRDVCQVLDAIPA